MASQQVARVGLPARLRANFGASLGAAPTSAAGECAGAPLAVRFRPALSHLAGAPAVELGNTLGVERGHRQDRQIGQGSVGRDGKQRRRARCYDKVPSSVRPHPSSAGVSRQPDHG